MQFSTKAIHVGSPNDPTTGAVAFPIYQTSTYSQDVPGHPREYQGKQLSYGRSENPTRTALENAVASLEEASIGVAFATGLAAINAILLTLKTGDHVLAAQDLYGGAYRQFTKIFTRFGVEFDFVNTTDLANVTKGIKPNTRLLWLESPSNPLLNITDLAGAAKIARQKGVTVVVDNTFATPALQLPLKLGADVIIHSATKYINGHSDVVSGIVVTNDEEMGAKLRFNQNAVGAIPGPQDCFLVLRGLKTLELRMQRHCENAHLVADFLKKHKAVETVYYPGHPSHPNHKIAKKQMSDFGGMVSFVLKGGQSQFDAFFANLGLFTIAESLGGIKSLIAHPPSMTHASMEPEARRRAGIDDGLIRISCGLENGVDLIADLKTALSAASKA
ncbi:MAG: PLP-dependent aspartate aminotransferase family protein [bacterium]